MFHTKSCHVQLGKFGSIGTWSFQVSFIKTTSASDADTSDLDADKVIKLDTSVDVELEHFVNIAVQCMSINAYSIRVRYGIPGPGPPPRPISNSNSSNSTSSNNSKSNSSTTTTTTTTTNNNNNNNNNEQYSTNSHNRVDDYNCAIMIWNTHQHKKLQ